MNFTDQEREVELTAVLTDVIKGGFVNQSILLPPFGVSVLAQEM